LGSETKPWDADWSATPVTVTQATIGAYCADCVPCDDANVEINGTAFDTVAAGGTLDVPVVNTAATPVGTVNAGVDVVVPDATYQLKDSAAGNIGSPGAIASGASANITAPDATISVNSAAFGNALSNGSLDVPVKDTSGASVGSKIGSEWIVPSALHDTISFEFAAFTNAVLLTVRAANAGTYIATTNDGGSGTITFSKNGGAFGAFANPTVLAAGDTIEVRRTTLGANGWVEITQ
jgi:hypothetical protein